MSATVDRTVSSSLRQRAKKDAAHLRLNGLTKRFGAVTAVDHIQLDIPAGSFATLLGPSGCGKTTLLRIIAGFYEPDEGTILLNDKRIDQRPAHARGTAMVFQDYALFPHMRVWDNIAYGLRLAKVPKDQVERRVTDTLEFVGIGDLGQRWPNQLSGGQQQRVALARALVVEPEVLLLDEPLSNLDANLRERLRWELRALQQRLNITFVYVTHDQAEALAMSDWIAVISKGHVEQWGEPWEMYYYPETSFMADFIGSANLQPATILGTEGNTVVVDLNGRKLVLPRRSRNGVESPTGGAVKLCIRPETIVIGMAPAPAPFVNLEGTLIRRAFLGHYTRYWVQAAGREWIVDQSDPGALGHMFDGNVNIGINTERVHIIVQ